MTTLTVTPSIQRRITTTLFLAQSLFSAATVAAFTLTPIVAAQITGNDSLAGIPSTVLMLGRAVASYPLGWMMDRVGRRAGFSLGFLLATLGLAISAVSVQMASFLLLCAGSFLLGMGRSASEQTRFAAAEIYAPAQRARAIGTVVFAGTLGAVGGPLLVGPASHFMEQWGLNANTGPYVFSTLLVFLALGMLFLLLRPDPQQIGARIEADLPVRGDATSGDTGGGLAALLPILSRKIVQFSLLALVIGQLVMTLLMVITPLHMHHHQHDNSAIAWVIAAHNLGMFGLSGLTGFLIDRLGRIPMVGAGALVLVLSSLMTPISADFFLLATALFLLGLGWNFAFIAASSLLADALESHERGRIQGVSETLIALAAGASSLGSGGAFALGGMVAVAAVGLAFSLLLLSALFWFGRGSRDASVA